MRFRAIMALFKVGQTKVENMSFCRVSQNLVLKVDLGTHLTDKSASRFLVGFRAILDLRQTWSNKGLKSLTFSNWSEFKF